MELECIHAGCVPAKLQQRSCVFSVTAAATTTRTTAAIASATLTASAVTSAITTTSFTTALAPAALAAALAPAALASTLTAAAAVYPTLSAITSAVGTRGMRRHAPWRRLPLAVGRRVWRHVPQPALRHVLRRAERWRPSLVDVPGLHVGRPAVHHAGRGAPALRERRDLHGLRLVREHRDE